MRGRRLVWFCYQPGVLGVARSSPAGPTIPLLVIQLYQIFVSSSKGTKLQLFCRVSKTLLTVQFAPFLAASLKSTLIVFLFLVLGPQLVKYPIYQAKKLKTFQLSIYQFLSHQLELQLLVHHFGWKFFSYSAPLIQFFSIIL